MALSLGKLTFIVGAGLLGSVLAKERQMPSVSDVFSGAYKIFLKNDSAPSSTKPKNDSLMAQIKIIKQELQSLSNGSVTIVTSHGGGGRRYGVVVLVLVVGYGYIWWKGWKLPDLTFATKRSLSDACTAVAKQLDQVYSSVAVTKRDLSSRIDSTDIGLNDLSEVNAATRVEVSHLRGEMGTFDENVQCVREVVEILENRIQRMQGNEDAINSKVKRLVSVAQNIEQRRSQDALQGAPSTASRPAIEHPQMSPALRTLSLPPSLSQEPPSPISNGSNESQYQLNGAASSSGLKDIQDMSPAVNFVASSPRIYNGNGNGNPLSEGVSGLAATGGFFGRIASSNIPFLSRTRSGTQPK